MDTEKVVFDVEIIEYGETRGNFPVLREDIFIELLKTGNWTSTYFSKDGYKYLVSRYKEIDV